METQYPVLTYGTLRPGCGNYTHFLKGYTTYEANVTVEGFNMFGFYGYPYVVDGFSTIHATLNFINPTVYEQVMEGLDSLEGYHGDDYAHNHYERVLVDVPFAGTVVKAWMYVARNPQVVARAQSLTPIVSGDWYKFSSR